MSVPKAELRVERLVPTLTSAVIIAALEVVLASSFAALIFSGDLSRFVQAGIGLNLVAGIFALVVLGIGATQPGTVGTVQDVSAVILALIATGIATRLGPNDARTFLTVVAAIGITSVVTGGVFVALGTLRLGDMVRFVPYPVVGGFLAGTGWLLFKGGIGVMTGASPTMAGLPDLFGGDLAARWIPGVAMGVALLIALRTRPHYVLIPGTILASVVLFYVVLAVSGTPVGSAEANGWLLGPFPAGGLWHGWSFQAIGHAQWGAVAAQAGNIATVAVLALLALLLNASGIEIQMNRDLDLNRELRAAGVGNVLSGVAGGPVGFHALSLTALASLSGARSRLVGVISGGLCFAVLLFGGSAVSRLPRFVLGGLVLLLGLSFLAEWLYDAWFRLARSDYAVVVLILLVIGVAGFIQGVAVGLVVAVILFVVAYSRTDVVRHALDASSFASNVDRSAAERETLRATGQGVQVLELQGFVFFGSAKSLVDRIARRVRDPSLPRIDFLVLDFHHVTGLDSSAVMSLAKVLKLADLLEFRLGLTGLTPTMRARLAQGGLAEGAHERLRVFADLDHGMQWCEDTLLDEAADGPAAKEATLETWFGDLVANGHTRRRLMKYLSEVKVRSGRPLMRKGEPATELYFLRSGRLTAQTEGVHGPMRLRAMGPGTVVGELPLYLGTERTATVVAEKASSLYRLTVADFRRMQKRDPDLAAALHRLLAQLLAARLVDSQRTMSVLLD